MKQFRCLGFKKQVGRETVNTGWFFEPQEKRTYFIDVWSTVFCDAASLYRLAAVKLFLAARLLIVVSTVLAGMVDDRLEDGDDERLEMCDDMAALDDVTDVTMVAGNSWLLFNGKFNCSMLAAGDVESPWGLSAT